MGAGIRAADALAAKHERENGEEPSIKRMNIKEFREFGFLQEVNRKFFHPLGLALEVIIEEDGAEKLGGIWDSREDPEGMIFADDMLEHEKFNRVADLRDSKKEHRMRLLGSYIQAVPPEEGEGG